MPRYTVTVTAEISYDLLVISDSVEDAHERALYADIPAEHRLTAIASTVVCDRNTGEILSEKVL